MVSLIPSSGGVFEVKLEDELLFSKKELGRFPESDEVEKFIREVIRACNKQVLLLVFECKFPDNLI